ncbi:LexA family transcriptional regulator [Erythrobacter litoralis]|uniref:LexA family transcriptional regulator n=1 Tax=Erythrobacter litoralis TaxID=39960 RepID=UPI0024348C55|nr:LexA family transcriptional regulator [Erythrobacter litoralis]MDG6078577.1 LexA family transcriptional regulator [Erythrobacter litoralis]
MKPSENGEQQARKRLQEAARERGTSLAALSRVLGRNAAYLQQYVSRGSPRHLDEPDLRKIAEFLGIPAGQIETRPHGPVASSSAMRSEDWIEVRRLPLDASAGPGSFSVQEISFDVYRFSRKWLREMGLEGADLSAIRVEGDSMEPLLRSGDEIFVDRNKRAGEGIHVIRIGDALHVKQVHASAPGRIKLISANDAYAPIELTRDEVEIIGRVVWKGGRV